jgi:hypothetical protein
MRSSIYFITPARAKPEMGVAAFVGRPNSFHGEPAAPKAGHELPGGPCLSGSWECQSQFVSIQGVR